jgi:hypothetical protein
MPTPIADGDRFAQQGNAGFEAPREGEVEALIPTSEAIRRAQGDGDHRKRYTDL